MMVSAILPNVDLRKLLAGAQLPALPQSAIRLLELSQDPENGPADTRYFWTRSVIRLSS